MLRLKGVRLTFLVLSLLIVSVSIIITYFLTQTSSIYQSKALSADDPAFTTVYQQDFSNSSYVDTNYWTLFNGLEQWNGEKQYYYSPNVAVSNGSLNLTAKKESVGGCNYTSGKIVTRLPQKYGKYEVVAKVPRGRGVWPAIWLFDDSNGTYGEIDIMEYVGKIPNYVYSTVHFGKDPDSLMSKGKEIRKTDVWKDYHTYTLEWTANKIEVFVDGVSVYYFDMATSRVDGLTPLDKPLYFMINNALGGDWGGPISNHIFPSEFKIKSIKVWKWNQ